MASYPIPLNLSTVTFTAKSDTVKVTGSTTGSGPAIFLTTPKDTLGGDDTIQATVSATPTGGGGTFVGIYNESVLTLGAGVDKIIAEVNALATPIDWSFVGYSAGGAQTILGTGDDVVKGSVTVGGAGFNGFAIGITAGAITGGAGNDEVNGYAKLTATPIAGAVVEVSGVKAGPINLGADNDVVIGKAEASIATTLATSLHVAGLRNVEIDTGDHNDSVIAQGTLALGAGGGDAFVLGVYDSDIKTGGGKDDLEFKGSYSGTGDDIFVRVYGLYDTFVDTGVGDDYLKASAKGGGNAWATEAGYYTLGDGNDVFDVEASGGHYDTVGIRYGTMNAGKGNDGIYVRASGATADSVTHGIFQSGAFDLGEGNDTLDVRATSAGGPANGIYNSADIVAGKGADKIIAIAKAGVGYEGYGLNATTIQLGDGDDVIQAKGSTTGIHDAFIYGGAGKDVFDLDNGTGLVDGGADKDLLKLLGAKGDYLFTSGGAGHVLISDAATNGDITLIDVFNVETFQFGASKVLSYDALFGI